MDTVCVLYGPHNIILDNRTVSPPPHLISFLSLCPCTSHYRKEFDQSVTMTPYEALVLRASRPVTKGGAAATAVLGGWVAIAILIKMALFG